MMASFTGVVLFTVTACALLRSIAPESFLQGTQESASGSGSGDDQQALAPQFASEANDLPVCGDNELLTFEENQLVCRRFPERRCRCAEVPDVSTAVPPTPLTPQGCPVFEPPPRGAFVCILEGDAVIYCSVYCENRYEFSTTPLNPYRCGIITRFAWTDFTNKTHQELPRCTGFRHRLRTLYPDEFYLPTPCDQLTENNITTIKNNFCSMYNFFTFMDCNTTDVVIQCPRDG